MKKLDDIVFFDIETIPLTQTFEELPETSQLSWETICKRNKEYSDRLKNKETFADLYWDQGSLFYDFSRCYCVSFGVVGDPDKIGSLKLKENTDEGEAKLIEDVCKFFSKRNGLIGGWNIKSFDVPYIFKKAIKYGVDPVFIPKGLQIFEKKPWETKLFDLSELWKMTGFQTQTLSTVCDFLGVQSPKEELEGKFVKNVYYNDYRDVPPYLNEPYERIRGYQTQSQEDRESLIVKYCEADVKSNIDIAKIIAPYF